MLFILNFSIYKISGIFYITDMNLTIDFNRTTITLTFTDASEALVNYACHCMDNYYDCNGLENYFITPEKDKIEVTVCWSENEPLPTKTELADNIKRWYKLPNKICGS